MEGMRKNMRWFGFLQKKLFETDNDLKPTLQESIWEKTNSEPWKIARAFYKSIVNFGRVDT